MAERDNRPSEQPKPEGKVFSARLVGRVEASSVKEVIKDIDTANEKDDVASIRLLINSGGGSIWDGYAVYDHVLASEKPVDIVAAGQCMSMGVAILQAGRERLSYPHTVFMVHPSSFSMSGAEIDEVMENARQYQKDHKYFNEITRKRSGLTKVEFEAVYKPKKYLTAKEALKLGSNGLIDRIIPHTKRNK